ncbi:MAG: hypothetical protein ACI8RD_012178 [Bacillariaceae sp.]|jgi:hypothetical protein
MSSTSSAMSTTTTTATTTTFNQEVVDNGSNTASRGEYFDVELKVDKCKFYPLKPLAVIAGNVVSVTSTVAIDDSESTAHHHPQQQLKIGDRCLVNVAPSTGQVLSLMKRWANECRENKKCTNWITIAEHMVICRIDIDTTMLELEKSRSVCDAYILRCSRPGAIVRICDPSTLYVTILMDQSKFYPSKLAILDGVILKINEDNTATSQSSSSSTTTSSTIRNSNKDLSCLLEKGERCWLHVRSNVVSLLKTLHGESMTGIDDDNENENENTGDNNGNSNSTNIVKSKKKKSKIATGWVQFTRSIPVTCRIVIDNNLLKRKCNLKGAFTLECYEIIDIQKSEINSNIIPTRKNHNDLKTKDECDIIPQNRDIVHHPPKRLDRKERHRVFAEFLVNTYGADFLSTGSGVLDVAGGGGALSHALFNLGIKSCVLDPDPRCDVETVPFQVIDEPLSGDGLQLTGVVADNDKNGDDDVNNYLSDDHTTAKRRSRIRKLVRSCSVIVGMHPDEATEAVIDTSLRLGKPFAILPCCVFRNLNAERLEIRKQKLGGGSGGDPFRSYNTFCQYLLDNKAPVGIRFETENLPFEGRNKVIYLQSYSYTCQVINP